MKNSVLQKVEEESIDLFADDEDGVNVNDENLDVTTREDVSHDVNDGKMMTTNAVDLLFRH